MKRSSSYTREAGVVLRGEETHSLSWEETYRAMAAESEDWSELDVAIADGVACLTVGGPLTGSGRAVGGWTGGLAWPRTGSG